VDEARRCSQSQACWPFSQLALGSLLTPSQLGSSPRLLESVTCLSLVCQLENQPVVTRSALYDCAGKPRCAHALSAPALLTRPDPWPLVSHRRAALAIVWCFPSNIYTTRLLMLRWVQKNARGEARTETLQAAVAFKYYVQQCADSGAGCSTAQSVHECVLSMPGWTHIAQAGLAACCAGQATARRAAGEYAGSELL